MRTRRAIGALAGLVAWAWLSSLRLRLSIDPRLGERLPGGLLGAARSSPSPHAGEGRRGVVLVFWHGEQFALLRWARRRGIAALVSRSPDGELLAAALSRLGFAVERGSSSRGGAEGLRALVRRLRRGAVAAVAADGPRGPRRKAFSRGGRVGAALAAELGGALVVPLASASARGWVLPSWDAFELPLPFSRVAVALGPPLEPRDASPEAIGRAIEAARARAESLLAPAAPRSGRGADRARAKRGVLAGRACP